MADAAQINPHAIMISSVTCLKMEPRTQRLRRSVSEEDVEPVCEGSPLVRVKKCERNGSPDAGGRRGPEKRVGAKSWLARAGILCITASQIGFDARLRQRRSVLETRRGRGS